MLFAIPVMARVLTAIVSNPPSGGPVGWFLAEDFEGGGYQNTWNVGGDVGGTAIVDPDYNTPPAPLLGSDSFRVTQGSFGQKYIYNNYIPTIATGTNSTGCYFQFCALTNLGPGAIGTQFFALADNASDETNLKLYLNSSLQIVIDSNGNLATTTDAITLGETNHVWVDWLSNNYARVMFTNSYSTNITTRPETNSSSAAQVTSGLGTKSVQQIFLISRNFSGVQDTFVFDHVRVAPTNILSFGYP